jgi:hypothetical protein
VGRPLAHGMMADSTYAAGKGVDCTVVGVILVIAMMAGV